MSPLLNEKREDCIPATPDLGLGLQGLRCVQLWFGAGPAPFSYLLPSTRAEMASSLGQASAPQDCFSQCAQGPGICSPGMEGGGSQGHWLLSSYVCWWGETPDQGILKKEGVFWGTCLQFHRVRQWPSCWGPWRRVVAESFHPICKLEAEREPTGMVVF